MNINNLPNKKPINDYDITVITPTLNAERWITTLLESISNQEGDISIQHIVVDGGSTDNTIAILKKNQIEHYIAQGLSIYESHNLAITKSKGAVVGFINSDDIYHSKSTLQKVIEVFKEKQDVDFIYGDCNFVNEQGKILYRLNSPKKLNYSISKLRLFNISHPCWFAKREVFELLGLYNTKYRYVSDMEFILRAVKRKLKFFKVNYVIADFVRHESNASSTDAASREGRELLKSLNGHSLFIKFLNKLFLSIMYLKDIRYLIFFLKRKF